MKKNCFTTNYFYFSIFGRCSRHLVSLKNSGDLDYGDTITLCAHIGGKPEEYNIYWEASKNGNSWFSVGSGSSYSFVVNEENVLYYYRVVLEILNEDIS